ncbi:AAA domain-containing protein [Spiroplasma turonicum]|uniref:Superfamily I DNA/RNA helicase n=1 Tax=Spiroplasma turonicum TaxID=216946 RepID=A0A0K1P7Q3_9MOLU|nr:AAA domain-containing protein [Spiroplasma turonicum]AKU80224.1 superfamily I DNA/RNA helicase [Spiroplasma turonicum]
MSSFIENTENKELVLDFSFMQNVKFKDNIAGLDSIIEHLEISGIKNYNDFIKLLKSSIVKQSFICMIDDKARSLSNSNKKTYDGIIRIEFDSYNQSLFEKGNYLGFFVNIDPLDASLTISSIFITRLKPIAQDFETKIGETKLIVLKHKNQISTDEILRRNILNSSTILQVGKLVSKFEEEKTKWLEYLNFCEDLLKLQRKNSLPYLGADTIEVIKIDKSNFQSVLNNYKLNTIQSKSFIYCKLEALSLVENLNVNYDLVKVVSFDILVKDYNVLKKIKKVQDLYVLPLSFNNNIQNIHIIYENIELLFDFELIENSDQQKIIPLQLMLGVSEEYVSLESYWKAKKSIVFGSIKVLENYSEKYQKELTDWKVHCINFEVPYDTDLEYFNIRNNIDYLNSGYISYLGVGDDVLIERSRQVLKRISEGNTKNPYLINYLFNTKLIELSETNDDLIINDKDFYFALNDEQKEAVSKALACKDVFILQGPPGTGKTQVISEIVYQLAKNNKKILLSSQNHEAIKNVVDRLPIDPNINKVRLINQLNIKSSAANNFSPERVVYNYYRSIAKKIFDETNQNEETLNEFTELKIKLEKLLLTEKRFHKDNNDIRNIKNEINNIDKKLQEISSTYITNKSDLRNIKEDILNIDIIIDSLENYSFDAVVNFSEYLIEFFNKSLKKEITNFIILHTSINIDFDNMNNFYKILSMTNHEVVLNNDIFSSIQESKALIESYKRSYDLELAIQEESRLNGLYQIIQSDQKLKTLLDLYTLIIESLKIEKENLLNNLKSSTVNKEIQVEKNKLEVDRNKLLVTLNKINDSLNSNTKYLRDTIKFFNEKYDTNLVLTDVDLESNIESELNKVQQKIKDKITRSENNSNLYKSIVKYLKTNYLIDDDFSYDLPTLNFTQQMFAEGKKYTQTILNTLVNIYAMTLTSANIFRYKKDLVAKKIGLEEINLKTLDVDFVIIDEASKATLLEILMPLIYGKTLILVGDYRQLPPLLKLQSSDVDEVNNYFNKDYSYYDMSELLNESIFKKLISAKNNSITTMLKKQYRSTRQIMDVVNNFYENSLIVDEDVSELKKHDLIIYNKNNETIINPNNSVYWIDSTNDQNNNIFFEQSEEYSTSLFNELEIQLTKEVLNRLEESLNKQNKLKKPKVAIISFYALQVNKLKRLIKTKSFKNFELTINTVDDFQGKEADYVIVNLVRNPEKLSLNNGREFLKKYERINVAFSRARELLIIVGAERVVRDVMVKIPKINDPDIYDSKEVYMDIINMLDIKSCYLKTNDVLGD